jgi:hypothetical protein
MRSGRVGLEIAASEVRGVVVRGWSRAPAHRFTVPFSPDAPDAALAALRAEVSAPDGLWVAIAADLLHAARVELPPAPAPAREAMASLEPDRFFPTNDALQVGLAAGSDVAFAAPVDLLATVRRVLSAWAPVVRIEAGPVCVAATLDTDGTFDLPDGAGSIDVRGRTVTALRRLPSGRVLPENAHVPATYRAAWGALLRDDAGLEGTLLDATSRAQVRARVWRGVATAALGAAAAITFCIFSLERSRERTLEALTRDAERLAEEARPAIQAQAQLALWARDGELARQLLSTRPDPSHALAALGSVLPPDVMILSARASGHAWQIEGSARDAAALVPLLDADPRFDEVRSLAASSRFNDGGRSRESFSLSFRVTPRD